MKKQAWIYSAKLDGAFIIAPAFAVSILVLCFQGFFSANHVVAPLAWLALIVGVDVTHVYSTLYRTYFDKAEFAKNQTLYISIPLFGWLAFMFAYSIDNMVFWRLLAYFAVFHFVRQQYGFMMIYSRFERQAPKAFRLLDKTTIYMATIYPLIYWHLNLPRDFNWFIAGDFYQINLPIIGKIGLYLYLGLLAAYTAKEIYFTFKNKYFNIAKNSLLLGTILSWYIGIILLNSDLAFTFTNVIAHGIPYIALIWVYGRNQSELEPRKPLGKFFKLKYLPIFLAIPALFAFIEEGFWDAFIWGDNRAIFSIFALPEIDDKSVLTWLVPLLALPQITHYLLDAFIWRMNGKNTHWKKILFHKSS